MATTVYFRDTSTNQQLVGYPPPGDPTPLIVPGSYAVQRQLIAGANSTEYVLAFADITIDAGPPNFSRPVVISNPFNLLFVTAYLWYVPASELLNNGPNPPNTYVHTYRAPDCHKFVAAKFLVAKGTVTKELTSDPVSSSSHVRTDVATTIKRAARGEWDTVPLLGDEHGLGVLQPRSQRPCRMGRHLPGLLRLGRAPLGDQCRTGTCRCPSCRIAAAPKVRSAGQ